MAKQILVDILDKFADITPFLVETAKIKDDLKKNCTDLKDILECTKKQIENLSDKVTTLNNLFNEQYDDLLKKISTENDEPKLNEEGSEEGSVKDIKPLIKLVDINKLIEVQPPVESTPKNDSITKSVHFDDTVVIITSSDEDSPRRRIPLNGISRKQHTSRFASRRKSVTELKKPSFSDTSSYSSSSDSDSFIFPLNKEQQPRSLNKKTSPKDLPEVDVKSDPKFKAECHVKLLRVPCEKLKEYYLENLELSSIKKLCQKTKLKRKRKTRTDSSDSGSNQKKSENKITTKSQAEIADSDSSSQSYDFSLPDVTDSNNKEAEEQSQDCGTRSEDLVEHALSELLAGSEESAPSEQDTSLPEKKEPSKTEEKEEILNKTMEEDQKRSSDEDKDASRKAPSKKDKLLTGKILTSDSNDEAPITDKEREDLTKYVNKKKKLMKRKLKKAILSDSDVSSKSSSDEDSEAKTKKSADSSGSEKESELEKPKSRRRIKRARDSSSDEERKSTRKQIRNILGSNSLTETTKKAEAEEKERKARITEKQKKYNQLYENNIQENTTVDKIILDYDEENKKELLRVDDALVSKLKPHQASGIQFMWDACFESLERAKTTKGSGCILAHCMGLGKTLQVITLSHTLLVNSEETNVRKVLVVSPLNTVLNWVHEFKHWLPDEETFDVFELVSYKQNYDRYYQVKLWHENGGVLIIGYDMFRNLSNPANKRISKKFRSMFQAGLVDPGPDLVVCDEGHLLKNEKTNISIAMNRIRSLRRIVLTGTPLQNNLKEYFCMVQFIKPSLLGTYKEYLNRFVNPITNGQYTDSTPHDIQIMRKRSHVLHKMLDGVVQRRDYAVLAPYLKPKFEYVLFLKLTETQIKLYQHYMEHFARKSLDGSNRTSFLFVDFQALQRICTHPRVLLDKSIEMKSAKSKRDETDSEGSLKDFINDDDSDEASTSSNSNSDNDKSNDVPKKRLTRAALATAKENGEDVEEIFICPENPEEKEWWQEYCDGDELNVIKHSSKLFLLFEILKECEQIGDKVLVFSQSLYSLNIIEYFLEKIHDATQNGDTLEGYTGSWCIGLDYFRLDGSSSCDNRSIWCNTFNDPENQRARLFLISTRAGGLGINLVAANRVIIFDVSWNPSHDVQSIYRVYRFGQTKPSYIYRFVTLGTMEMKIYERQVTKQAISKRVIDEQQIDRHYNQNDLTELYKFEPDPGERPIPLVPKDVLLGELLQKFEDRLHKYHEHQSLLENKEEECLNEDERKAAWDEFENEKKQRHNWVNSTGLAAFEAFLGGNTFVNNMDLALASIIQKQNPLFTQEQVKLMLPHLHAQMQQQITKGDLTLYRRVMKELQMQALQQQMFQQQMKMMQQQAQIGNTQLPNNANWNNTLSQMPSTSQVANGANAAPTDIIELND